MAETCGYRQHDQLVNALKVGHIRESSQAQEKSKTSHASDEVIKELQNQVAVLTDPVKSNMAAKEVPKTGTKGSIMTSLALNAGNVEVLVTSKRSISAFRKMSILWPARPYCTNMH